MLDYSGDVAETGKNLGDDLAEGKPTLPLLYVMANGNPAQQAEVRRAITEPGTADFAIVLEAIAQTGALDYTRRAASAEAQLAAGLLVDLPDSPHKQTLLQLCAFAVERRS